MKWIVGFGGISAFTLFLQTIDANDQALKGNENYALNDNMDNMNVLNATENAELNKEEREQQLLSLDWDESNWDVEYSNETIVASPRTQMPYLDRAQQRTRRS